MLPQNLCFTIKKMNIPSEFVLKRRKAHKKRVLRRFVVIIMTTYCKNDQLFHSRCDREEHEV